MLVGYVWITCYTYMAHSYIYDWWLTLAVETLICCGEFVMALWYIATSFAAFWFTVETLGLVLQRPHTATQRPDCIMLWCYIYCYTISTAQCGGWHMLPLWTFSCCGTSEKVPGKFSSYIYWSFSCYLIEQFSIYDLSMTHFHYCYWYWIPHLQHTLSLWTSTARKLPGRFQESSENWCWTISAVPPSEFCTCHPIWHIPDYYCWCWMPHQQ